MWAFWPLVCCFLCLVDRPEASPTDCSWRDLRKEEFSSERREITVKAKIGQKDNLVLTLQEKYRNTTYIETIQPPEPYNLSMGCEDISCGYTLLQGKRKIDNQYLIISSFKKFIVEGKNLEWLHCTPPSQPTTTEASSAITEPNGNNTNNVSKGASESPPVWVLALVGAGVAVTVASISVFIWCLCGAYKNHNNG